MAFHFVCRGLVENGHDCVCSIMAGHFVCRSQDVTGA